MPVALAWILLTGLFEKKPETNEYDGPEYSSGRIDDWKNILKFNERKLLGNGVLGDRNLINQSATYKLYQDNTLT